MPNASEMANSNEILSLYKHDERAALQKLFDIYYEPLLLYCYRLIRDSESAEDIVQDCFVHIWRLGAWKILKENWIGSCFRQ